MTISENLKAARAALGLTQAEAARKFEMPIGSLRKYESGPSEPGSAALSGIVRAGINANWLLTGEGPMLVKDLSPKPEPVRINHQALAVMFEAAQIAHPKATITRQAALAAEFYALCAAEGTVTADDIIPPAQDAAA